MKKALVVTALALSAVIGVQAQPQGGHPPRHHGPRELLVAALDSNTNGVISAEEIANASAALLTLDKNNDNQLTQDELYPQRPRGDSGNTNPPRFVPPLIAALDTDADGTLSQQEIANASASLAKLDTNNDGQLTRDEIMPKHPGGPGGPGHRPQSR
jgi:Ca2+-binding EF-hand superfamily protein